MRKNLEEEPGSPVYVLGAEKVLGQGEAEVDAPETEGDLFVAVSLYEAAVVCFAWSAIRN
ncbi:MAG: hypothetical protein LBQ46_02715 [Treponema sp.]|nr:hypothetical protein [Treponema sp.]